MKVGITIGIILQILISSNITYSQNCADSTNIYTFTYDGRTYEIVKENKTWIDAASCAVERGGYLAEINSQEEQDTLYHHLQNADIVVSNTVAPDGGGASYVWIGGNDISTEGEWIWDGDNDGVGRQFWEGTSSGNAVDSLYNNWGNEPDNWNNQDGLGLAITNWPLGSNGQWNDVDDINSLYYLIEYDIEIREPTLINGSFEFDGHERIYEVYLPQNYEPNMPVVLALHGYEETIDWFKRYTLFHEYADTSGFIIVFPKGSTAYNGIPGWNTGLVHDLGKQDSTANDVGFISALIDTIINDYNVDISRIYSCGFSMGGEMTYKLAGEIGERFAAVASVAGLINENSAKTINPIRPIPVLHIHGDQDNVETWDGSRGNLWSVVETVNYWVQNNECSPFIFTINLPDLDVSDGCTVEKIIYKDTSNNPRVLFYKIVNGGHSWPSLKTTFYSGGNKNKDINANEEIWNFFKNYENPLVSVFKNELDVPNKLKLSQNYPNPFNPRTIIKYSIPKQSNVILRVFDVIGREVTALINEDQPKGNYEIEFSGGESTSGIYFYRLEVYPDEVGADNFVETKKMLLLK